MTDRLLKIAETKRQRVKAGVARRRAKEKRFRFYGIASISMAFAFLIVLMTTIVSDGYTAFVTTEIKLTVDLSPETLGIESGETDKKALMQASFRKVLRKAILQEIPVDGRKQKRALYKFLSNGAEYDLRDMVIADPSLIGKTIEYWAQAGDNFNQFNKGNIKASTPEDGRQFKDLQIEWYDELVKEGNVRTVFNKNFFTNGDSRDAELAGIWGATVGSFYTLIVTLALSFPIGVAAAIYLEEFAPRNRATELIEININNLAAVPSIVFGLLGLAVFLNVADLPRSAPVVGGLVLTLMTLPTIIISSRAAIKAVPPSVRDAALGVGASKMQMVLHHVLPLAMPGMLTGTIIGMAQALGETAPLLMIGMVAFVVDIPGGPLDAATALPVQIYLWAENPEKGFVENTSGAIMVLLAFLAFMNACAVIMRKRLERRW
ncbi:phosphate ABC transporter permease PstA [Enterovibrio sp. ZSDZ35]|uniref:Phosphate transport system permease protein PstA n=1 Tax=Enterovibrio qingdaonensis TaxID=2899818 RepID=A0ABT5QQ55_9GAMM|nr:phosphate ABC transporter permease PstA [Enterovibrio sp. ZSDZ35]MDD1783110.1 phosphate ABC transporter permease PstA [Enterovibrio sp. ZSDZ35]